MRGPPTCRLNLSARFNAWDCIERRFQEKSTALPREIGALLTRRVATNDYTEAVHRDTPKKQATSDAIKALIPRLKGSVKPCEITGIDLDRKNGSNTASHAGITIFALDGHGFLSIVEGRSRVSDDLEPDV
jgi:hypothetical protein